MPIGTILKDIFTSGADKLVKSVGDAFDKNFTSKDEMQKNGIDIEKVKEDVLKAVQAHEEAMGQQIIEHDKLDVDNTKSAREMNSAIQGTAPSWLAKNVAYCIDIFIMLIWGSITCYLLARMLNFIGRDARVDLTAVLAVWGGITAMATTVINFHRGSTQSSKQKDDVIQKIAQQP